jgi:hypothetical protein
MGRPRRGEREGQKWDWLDVAVRNGGSALHQVRIFLRDYLQALSLLMGESCCVELTLD